MNTVKLMVVNVARERESRLIGCVFDAVEVRDPLGMAHVIQGGGDTLTDLSSIRWILTKI